MRKSKVKILPVIPQSMHSENIVWHTTNYNAFVNANNRNIDKNHVQKIAESMMDTPEKASAYPITIDEKFNILDGQHRFEASKLAGHPVYYIVTLSEHSEREDVFERVIEHTSSQKKQSMEDVFQIRIKGGCKEARQAAIVAKKCPNLRNNTVIKMLYAFKGGGGGRVMDRLQDGTYAVRFQKELVDLYDFIENEVTFSRKWKQGFVQALAEATITYSAIQFKKLVRIINKHPNFFNGSSSKKVFTRDFELALDEFKE